MLTIFATTNLHPQLQQTIEQEDRLSELVSIEDIALHQQAIGPHLLVDAEGIHIPYAWDQSLPPYRFPNSVSFSSQVLLGLIFHILGNDQKSWEYLQDQEVYHVIAQQNRLRYGQPVLVEPLRGTPDARALHNQAVLQHYGGQAFGEAGQNPAKLYQQAAALSNVPEEKAFSLRELATIYLDHAMLTEAEASLQQAMHPALPPIAHNTLKLLQIKIWMQQLSVPYDEALLQKLKHQLWEVLTYFEKHQDSIQVGLLLLDAIHIAQISDSFAEALGYAKRAIDIFEEAGLPELAANAHLKKGTLLYAWAQNGNPQFYRPAVESYQKAVLVFNRENAPGVYADIQHHLAVLYSEMPADNKKRSVWAGVAASAFEEALRY